MDNFADNLTRFIENYFDAKPDTSLEEIIAALEAKAIAMRREITSAGNPGAN